MTQLGEGVAAPVTEVVQTGTLKISVRDACDGSRIKKVSVAVGTNKKDTDDSGEAVFSGLPLGLAAAYVKKHFKEADYITFISQTPRIVRRREAISATSDSKEITANSEAKLRIEIPVFKVVDKIRFRRIHLKLKPLDYGHWWVVVGNNSYGWWPEPGHLGAKDMEEPVLPASPGSDASVAQQIQHMAATASYHVQKAGYAANYSTVGNYGQAIVKTFAGVPGILNGDDAHKNAERDPHHDDSDFEEEYSPVVNDCTTYDDFKTKIRDFSFGYSGEWSWRFEAGKNCHTFQKEMINVLGLKMFKDWKA
jgi:hypothetical protein